MPATRPGLLQVFAVAMENKLVQELDACNLIIGVESIEPVVGEQASAGVRCLQPTGSPGNASSDSEENKLVQELDACNCRGRRICRCRPMENKLVQELDACNVNGQATQKGRRLGRTS